LNDVVSETSVVEPMFFSCTIESAISATSSGSFYHARGTMKADIENVAGTLEPVAMPPSL